MLSWNNDEGTADLSLLDGTVLQMGQELHYRARNNTASTIADGAVVWATGTTGATGRINVGLAVADGSQPGKTVMGLMTHATAAGSDGYVAAFGKVRGINTTGSAVGETWLNGDILYLHPTIPGALTKVKPAVNGNIVVTVAIVIYAGNNGTLFVRPTADSQEADEIRYTPAGTGAVATTVQSKLRETVSVKDFGAVGDGSNEAAKIQAALNSGAAIVDGNGLSCKINSSITIAANQTLQNIKLVAGTAGMNMVLVNTGSKLLNSKLTGTGTVSIVERGVYPAADGVNDVEIDAEVTNITYGVQACPLSSAVPQRWRVSGYIHDIVGTTGSSEGYGVLLSPAENCTVTTKFKTIKRHAVYLSAGASYNDVDVDVDGCENLAVQIYSLSTQPECKHNRIRGRFRNLSQNFVNQGGAVGVIQKASQNDISVQVDGSLGLTSVGIWVEGQSGGPYPSGNNIHDCEITGTYLTSAMEVRNADSTGVRNNRIYANWASAAIFMNTSGTAAVNSGGFVEGNYIYGAGSTNLGIANGYEVPIHVGTNDIKNISGAKWQDYSTAKKRTGRLKSCSGTVRTGSASAGNYVDTAITLPEAITASTRVCLATIYGPVSSVYSNYTINVFNTNDTTITIRVFNGSGTATAFDVFWRVEGD